MHEQRRKIELQMSSPMPSPIFYSASVGSSRTDDERGNRHGPHRSPALGSPRNGGSNGYCQSSSIPAPQLPTWFATTAPVAVASKMIVIDLFLSRGSASDLSLSHASHNRSSASRQTRGLRSENFARHSSSMLSSVRSPVLKAVRLSSSPNTSGSTRTMRPVESISKATPLREKMRLTVARNSSCPACGSKLRWW